MPSAMANYSKQEERRRALLSMLVRPNGQPDHPPKRNKVAPGPTPSVADLAGADSTTWFWVHCPAPCHHSAAVPWQIVIDRLGPRASADRLRRVLKCTVCNHKGASVGLVSRSRHDLPPPTIPLDFVPDWIRVELQDQ